MLARNQVTSGMRKCWLPILHWSQSKAKLDKCKRLLIQGETRNRNGQMRVVQLAMTKLARAGTEPEPEPLNPLPQTLMFVRALATGFATKPERILSNGSAGEVLPSIPPSCGSLPGSTLIPKPYMAQVPGLGFVRSFGLGLGISGFRV